MKFMTYVIVSCAVLVAVAGGFVGGVLFGLAMRAKE